VKRVINLGDMEGQPTFAQGDHSGTINHRLAWSGNGATNLAVWHGNIDPGGEADEHSHADEDQAFLILGGECRFWLDDEESRLGAGDFVFVPKGIKHRVISVGQEALRLLVILAPPVPE